MSGGARAIACFSFDNMGEAAEVGAGALAGPRPPGADPSLVRGYPAVLTLLERHAIRSTFFVEGWNGVHHPDEVAEIVRRGHELGMHGWLHEDWGRLDPAVERDLAVRSTDALESASGVRPRGFRAPGGVRGPRTERTLIDLGYRYDASLGDGMRPAVLPSGLAQVPFVWPGVDGFHYLAAERPAAPQRVRDVWLAALRRAVDRGGLFLTVCHPFLTGVDAARLEALEAVIEAAAAQPGVRILTVGEAAETVAAAG
jgi:peptidoglycan/xylan/chitin deacetylase (PgdA/CDA1 family)